MAKSPRQFFIDYKVVTHQTTSQIVEENVKNASDVLNLKLFVLLLRKPNCRESEAIRVEYTALTVYNVSLYNNYNKVITYKTTFVFMV